MKINPLYPQLILLFSFFFFVTFSCQSPKKKLPILGFHQYNEKTVNNQKIIDTVYHQIADFSFLNQDSLWVNQETVKDKIYIADFFFTTCPDICPLMSQNMMVIYEQYKDNQDVLFLSHTIDPYNDTVSTLKKYEHKLGLSENQTHWHFLYGKQEDVFQIAKESYLATAMKDENAPKGVIHSGTFILIDKFRRIRGLYDGTTKEGTQKLLEDLPILLNEYSQQ